MSSFCFNDAAPTELYTLSLHDALPILATPRMQELVATLARNFDAIIIDTPPLGAGSDAYAIATATSNVALVLREGTTRSEEHTSELQSRLHLVCRLLLEKKKLPTSCTQ